MKKIIIVLALIPVMALAQKNLIKDHFFLQEYSVDNSTGVTDKWIHIINNDIVEGEIKRVKQYGFADSVIYCHAKYKTVSSSNRANCYLAQRVTGLENKKYRVSFWLNIIPRFSYLTAEVQYYNENYASETGTLAGRLVADTDVTTNKNYQVPDNWTHCSFDIDLTGVKDLNRLKIVRLAFYPSCNVAKTFDRDCHYFISEPKIYELSGSTNEYIRDNSFESWNISDWPLVCNQWDINEGAKSVIKRAPGHRDSDFGLSINTVEDNNNSFVESKQGNVIIPETRIKLSFYARSEDKSSEIRVGLKTIDNTQTVTLTDEWKRYELTFDYNKPKESFPLEDNIRFEFPKKGMFYIDECWITPDNSPGSGTPQISAINMNVYSGSGKIIVSGEKGYLQVYNTIGQNVCSVTKNENGVTEIDTPDAGVYLVRITADNNQSVVHKIVVKP